MDREQKKPTGSPLSHTVGLKSGVLAAPIFHHYVPRKPLSDFVELFWYWNHAPPPIKERILPGGAYPFFGAPVDKFLNEHVSLHDVWGSTAECLRSELLEAPDVYAKFQVLERRLIERAANSFSRHPVVAFVLGELGRGPFTRSLSELAAEVNLSSKRLTQLFSREVGVTPRLFARILSFQGAIRVLGACDSREWLDVALESGYYDQAHFNHDFLEFSGMNPTAYMQKRTEHLGHVPL